MLKKLYRKSRWICVILLLYGVANGINHKPYPIVKPDGNIDTRALDRTIQYLFFNKADIGSISTATAESVSSNLWDYITLNNANMSAIYKSTAGVVIQDGKGIRTTNGSLTFSSGTTIELCVGTITSATDSIYIPGKHLKASLGNGLSLWGHSGATDIHGFSFNSDPTGVATIPAHYYFYMPPAKRTGANYIIAVGTTLPCGVPPFYIDTNYNLGTVGNITGNTLVVEGVNTFKSSVTIYGNLNTGRNTNMGGAIFQSSVTLLSTIGQLYPNAINDFYSGASNKYTGIRLGRTDFESWWGVAGANDNWVTGSVAGDSILGFGSRLHLASSPTTKIWTGTATGTDQSVPATFQSSITVNNNNIGLNGGELVGSTKLDNSYNCYVSSSNAYSQDVSSTPTQWTNYYNMQKSTDTFLIKDGNGNNTSMTVGSGTFKNGLYFTGTVSVSSPLASYSRAALTPTNWGYNPGYRVLMLGTTGLNLVDAITLSLGYNPVANTDPSFFGNGNEILMPNIMNFMQPNLANNGWFTPVSFSNGSSNFNNNPVTGVASFTCSTITSSEINTGRNTNTGALTVISSITVIPIASIGTPGTPVLKFRDPTNPLYGYDFMQETSLTGDLQIHRVVNGTSSKMMRFVRSDGSVMVTPVASVGTPGSPSLIIRDPGNTTYGWDFMLETLATGDLALHRVLAGVSTKVMGFERAGGFVTFSSSIWITGDCSATTFTDRTEYTKDKSIIWGSINSMTEKSGGVDYDLLSPYLRKEFKYDKYNPIEKTTDTVITYGRDLTKTVSVHNEALKDLQEQIKVLEEKINKLEGK